MLEGGEVRSRARMFGQSPKRVDNLEPRRDATHFPSRYRRGEQRGREGRSSPRGEVPGRRGNLANKLSKEVAMVFIAPRPCHVSRNRGQLVHVAILNRRYHFFETFDCWIDQMVDVRIIGRLSALMEKFY